MKKLKLNTDKIIGLSAMLISLLTLMIFIYQTNIIREQSRLSVAPRLAFNSSLDTPDSISYFSFHLVNKGLGPAIVESIDIIHEKKRFKLDFRKFFKKGFPKFEDYGSIIQNMTISTGTAISEKDEIKFVTYSFMNKDTKDLLRYLEIEDKDKNPFEIEVIYSSIYGDKWKINSIIDGHPIKL